MMMMVIRVRQLWFRSMKERQARQLILGDEFREKFTVLSLVGVSQQVSTVKVHVDLKIEIFNVMTPIKFDTLFTAEILNSPSEAAQLS